MSEAYFPDDLRLRTYAGLSETLRLEQALRTTLLTLAPVLPADGVFVNIGVVAQTKLFAGQVALGETSQALDATTQQVRG